jgi:mannose-6-phosphate isomerase-like protein (cupin superfamily)
MNIKLLMTFGVLLAGSSVLIAQAPQPASYGSAASLEAKAEELLAQAKAAPSGNASETLEKFDNYYTMLSVRVKSGGAEYHHHWSDIFVVIKGEGTMLTGGTIPDMTLKKEGEYVGTKIIGGTRQVLKAGDTFTIPPRTPHQAFVDPSQPFIYYVIKVHD